MCTHSKWTLTFLENLMIFKLNKTAIVLMTGLSLSSCGSKNDNALKSSVEGMNNAQIALNGGSVTKEILIHTNDILLKKNSNQLIVGRMYTGNENVISAGETDNEIYKKINHAKISGLENANKNQSVIKPEYLIDLGVGMGAALTTVYAAPIAIPVIALGLTFGGSALKGYIQDDRQSELEMNVSKLTDRRDKDLLLLSISKSRSAGNDLLNELHAGINPSIVKERIKEYQDMILNNSELTASDMDKFLKNADDHFLLGLALSIKDNQNNFSMDVVTIKKSLKKNNDLLKEIGKDTKEFIERQNQVLVELNTRFSPEERSVIANALFESSNQKSLQEKMLKPEELVFFKNHPEKLKVYNEYLKNGNKDDLIHLVKIQESALLSYHYLQVSSQMANNLNFSPEIISAINKGSNVAEAASSLASFMVTSNPLDALNALSSFTDLFSKTKTDPRFTDIFDNFKQIQKTLQNIQIQLSNINNKLENIEDGLNYVIAQNKASTDLLIERSMLGKFKCSAVTTLISQLPKEDLNYQEIEKIFNQNNQGDNEKIDLCMRYLLDVFEDPFEQNQMLFSDKINSDFESDDLDLNKYFVTSNKLSSIYSKLYPYSANLLEGQYYGKDKLLSVGSIVGHVKQLIKSSFLFDFAKINKSNRSWELVGLNEIDKTIKKNVKSELLINNAIKLIEVSMVQQSVIDGTIESKELVNRFISSENVNCNEVKNSEIACLAPLNSTLLNNLVIKTFRKLIGHDFYFSWQQIANNNPEYINEKLANSPLKVVWVGSGSSDLFSGKIITSSTNYKDGAYLQLLNNEKLIPLPSIDSIKELGILNISDRVKMLQTLKFVLKNELIERNIQKILTAEEINLYNTRKIDQTLN